MKTCEQKVNPFFLKIPFRLSLIKPTKIAEATTQRLPIVFVGSLPTTETQVVERSERAFVALPGGLAVLESG